MPSLTTSEAFKAVAMSEQKRSQKGKEKAIASAVVAALPKERLGEGSAVPSVPSPAPSIGTPGKAETSDEFAKATEGVQQGNQGMAAMAFQMKKANDKYQEKLVLFPHFDRKRSPPAAVIWSSCMPPWDSSRCHRRQDSDLSRIPSKWATSSSSWIPGRRMCTPLSVESPGGCLPVIGKVWLFRMVSFLSIRFVRSHTLGGIPSSGEARQHLLLRHVLSPA